MTTTTELQREISKKDIRIGQGVIKEGEAYFGSLKRSSTQEMSDE